MRGVPLLPADSRAGGCYPESGPVVVAESQRFPIETDRERWERLAARMYPTGYADSLLRRAAVVALAGPPEPR